MGRRRVAIGSAWGLLLLGGLAITGSGPVWRVAAQDCIQKADWTWMKGASTLNSAGTYGTLGTPASANTPGGRNWGVSWTDHSGNLWLYGGQAASGSSLSDLWKYTIATGNWTWMKGSSTTGEARNYGTLGTPAATNTPGARTGAASWTDLSGNLWLFGGNYSFELNDLWRYEPATGNWTWMKGTSTFRQPGTYGMIGIPDTANTPGARVNATSWTDRSGKFWLFGGRVIGSGTGYYNDLWKYDPDTGNWTWMKGASTVSQTGTYGSLGTPAATNTPGGRNAAVSWIDNSDVLWLFGGEGYGTVLTLGRLNDLWKYDPTTGNWTWMKGSSAVNQAGVYGSLGIPAPTNTPGGCFNTMSWTGTSGALWLFGGFSESFRNDLWKYDPTTGNWTWIKGASTTNQPGTYGALGVSDAANTPGARYGSVTWTGESGALWLFGGWGCAASINSGTLNDLWRADPFILDMAPPVITVSGDNPATVECHTTYTDAGATADDPCAGDLSASIVVTNPVEENTPGTYTVRYNVQDGNGDSAVEATRTVHVVDSTVPSISISGDNPATVECHTAYTDAGATAGDPCAGDLSASIAVTNPVEENTPGTYTVRYNVNDGNGNSAVEVARTVHVVDSVKPVITLRGQAAVTLEGGSPYTDEGAMADDECAGSLAVTVGGSVVNPSVLGSYTVNYGANDGNGNDAVVVTRTVNVVDTRKPVITIAGSAEVTLDCGQVYEDAGATAEDAFWGDVTDTIVSSGLPPATPLGLDSWRISYDAVDGSGNIAETAWRTVTVRNNCTLAVTAAGGTVVHSILGKRVEISVVVEDAVGPVSFLWRKENVSQGGKGVDLLPHATENPLLIDPVVADSEGQYVCAVTDAVTTVDGPVFTLVPPTKPVPAAGLYGLAMAATALGLIGTSTLRRRRR